MSNNNKYTITTGTWSISRDGMYRWARPDWDRPIVTQINQGIITMGTLSELVARICHRNGLQYQGMDAVGATLVIPIKRNRPVFPAYDATYTSETYFEQKYLRRQYLTSVGDDSLKTRLNMLELHIREIRSAYGPGRIWFAGPPGQLVVDDGVKIRAADLDGYYYRTIFFHENGDKPHFRNTGVLTLKEAEPVPEDWGEVCP